MSQSKAIGRTPEDDAYNPRTRRRPWNPLPSPVTQFPNVVSRCVKVQLKSKLSLYESKQTHFTSSHTPDRQTNKQTANEQTDDVQNNGRIFKSFSTSAPHIYLTEFRYDGTISPRIRQQLFPHKRYVSVTCKHSPIIRAVE